MQVLQAGQHKLILREIDPAAVAEVAEQTGFEEDELMLTCLENMHG